MDLWVPDIEQVPTGDGVKTDSNFYNVAVNFKGTGTRFTAAASDGDRLRFNTKSHVTLMGSGVDAAWGSKGRRREHQGKLLPHPTAVIITKTQTNDGTGRSQIHYAAKNFLWCGWIIKKVLSVSFSRPSCNDVAGGDFDNLVRDPDRNAEQDETWMEQY